MQRVFFALAIAVGLAAFAAPSRAYAFGDERIKAEIPFAFHVDGVQLPAGQYVVEQTGMLDPQVATLRAG